MLAKAPRAGHAKTRLASVLGETRALEFYRASLRDCLGMLAGFEGEADVEVRWDARPRDVELRHADVAARLQGSGDLGARLARTFRESAAAGNLATVVIGADAPTLPPDRIRTAFRLLERGCGVALAPATDGGYVLVACREAGDARLFEDIPWGGPEVLRATLARARTAGVRVGIVSGWYDVDDGVGLARLRRELARPGAGARAPATARFCANLARNRPDVL